MSGARSLDMPAWECQQLLRERTIGRLCVVSSGCPLAFPVSYRTAARDGVAEPVLYVRTRPGGVISTSLGPASLEIDEVDAVARRAWSVIVRGTLGPVHDHTGLPVPEPWLHDGRHEWLVLEPRAISGRRFVAVEDDAFAVDWESVTG